MMVLTFSSSSFSMLSLLLACFVSYAKYDIVVYGNYAADPQLRVRNPSLLAGTVTHAARPMRREPQPRRNAACPCGSGRKNTRNAAADVIAFWHLGG
jgi:hypothetical protein